MQYIDFLRSSGGCRCKGCG